MGERRSNKSVKKCPSTTTSNCVEFVSTLDFPCLNICSGDSLTSVQEEIINKLCELVGEVDMSTVVIPECFTAAFATKDKTILEFINFLLSQACLQQNQINGLPTTNDPIISLDYRCCATNPCITETTVTFSQHLQNILICLCSQASRIDELESQVSDLQDELDSLTTQFNSLSTTVNKIVVGINNANEADSFPINIS